MFFRPAVLKVPTFSERVEKLRQAGFEIKPASDGRVLVAKHGVGAIIGDEGKNQTAIERAGVLINGEIAVLLNAGYQMFLEAPSGKRYPARSDELKALHSFEADVKDALELTDLYNTSLGTTSSKHQYDRVTARDQGKQPKPWERRTTNAGLTR
jgi:hypothetical protein